MNIINQAKLVSLHGHKGITMYLEKTCQECRSAFRAKTYRQKYCCMNCRKKWYKRYQKAYQKKWREENQDKRKAYQEEYKKLYKQYK